jgi:ubiquinone/menaquinone biosynthesis C-methylase UbiE
MKNVTYLSIDAKSRIAMFKGKIEDLNVGNDTFDCILCLQVLDYVEDDLIVLRNLYRMLKPGGWLIVFTLVQSCISKTIEHPNSPLKMGEIRTYGQDFVERLKNAGFAVSSYKLANEKGLSLFALSEGESLYYCIKLLSQS